MAHRPAVFGKLPRHGDFVSRGLDDPLPGLWDAWASGELVAARARCAQDFEAAHDTAPSWCFLVRDGQDWAAGAVAPSIDAAGRRFFLMVQLGGLELAEALALGAVHCAALEEVLYRGLAERLDVETLLTRVAEAGRRADPAPAIAWAGLAPMVSEAGTWWTLGGESHPPARAVGRWPPMGGLICGASTLAEATE